MWYAVCQIENRCYPIRNVIKFTVTLYSLQSTFTIYSNPKKFFHRLFPNKMPPDQILPHFTKMIVPISDTAFKRTHSLFFFRKSQLVSELNRGKRIFQLVVIQFKSRSQCKNSRESENF